MDPHLAKIVIPSVLAGVIVAFIDVALNVPRIINWTNASVLRR